MGTWPFLINLDNRFGDKFSFWYPVSELLDYKKSKNISFLFLKNSHSQLWNFSSILIHSSGIYVEKWYPEKWHILHRFIWKSSPLPLALCHSILIFWAYTTFKARQNSSKKLHFSLNCAILWLNSPQIKKPRNHNLPYNIVVLLNQETYWPFSFAFRITGIIMQVCKHI